MKRIPPHGPAGCEHAHTLQDDPLCPALGPIPCPSKVSCAPPISIPPFPCFPVKGVTLDRYSLHTGCPVLAGEKWSSTFWIHDNPFRRSPGSLLADIDSAPAPACEDQSTTCATLLAGREGAPCSEDQAARCRRSCGRCCQAGDVLCERRAKRIVAN